MSIDYQTKLASLQRVQEQLTSANDEALATARQALADELKTRTAQLEVAYRATSDQIAADIAALTPDAPAAVE